MRHAALFLFGLVLILVQSNLFRVLDHVHVPGLTPTLVLPIIVFMGVHEYPLAKGAGVAFALGYATDLVSIAPVGLFTFTFVALYVLTRAAGVRLAAQTAMMQIVVAVAAALVHAVMILVLLAIFGRDPYVPRALYPLMLPNVLSTGLLAPLVFRACRRVHTATARSEGAQGGRA